MIHKTDNFSNKASNMEISIVIPVYNAEKFLERAVESVIASLKKAKATGEILLVDNNSTDKSAEIIRRLARENRGVVRALSCKTPSAGAARNYGLVRAKGEYVWFIDADDTISEEAISKLLAAAYEGVANRAKDANSKASLKKANFNEKADLVMLGAQQFFANGREHYRSAVAPGDKSRFIRYGLGPWEVIFRREWWNEHQFRFREGMIHEDMELMSALVLYTDKFTSVDEPLYNYYETAGSVLHKEEFSEQIFDIFPALEGLYQRFEKASATEEYHDELEWFFIWNLLLDSAGDFAKFPEGKPGFSRTREMLKNYFPAWRKNRFLKEKSLKLKIRVRLNYWK